MARYLRREERAGRPAWIDERTGEEFPGVVTRDLLPGDRFRDPETGRLMECQAAGAFPSGHRFVHCVSVEEG